MMRVSKRGIETLMDMESVEPHAYYDEAQKLTIGVGHLLTQTELDRGSLFINGDMVVWRNGITRQHAEDLLMQDMRVAEDAVGVLVKVPLTQNQFDALVFFTFNVGVSAFRSSTLLRVLNQGHYEAVPAQMRRWVYVTKDSQRVLSKGLQNRREREVQIWNGTGGDMRGVVDPLTMAILLGLSLGLAFAAVLYSAG